MKKIRTVFLILLLSLFLCACGKQEPAVSVPTGGTEEVSNPVFEVKITLDNLYDYFEYKEYPSYYTDEAGNTTSVQISYGLALKEGYTAANMSNRKDTMEITFTADGIVNTGSFDVDFTTLQYSGTVTSTETKAVSETLAFWPKGDRTFVWAFGNYSSSYIIYLENFTVTSAKGSVFLKTV